MNIRALPDKHQEIVLKHLEVFVLGPNTLGEYPVIMQMFSQGHSHHIFSLEGKNNEKSPLYITTLDGIFLLG